MARMKQVSRRRPTRQDVPPPPPFPPPPAPRALLPLKKRPQPFRVVPSFGSAGKGLMLEGIPEGDIDDEEEDSDEDDEDRIFRPCCSITPPWMSAEEYDQVLKKGFELLGDKKTYLRPMKSDRSISSTGGEAERRSKKLTREEKGKAIMIGGGGGGGGGGEEEVEEYVPEAVQLEEEEEEDVEEDMRHQLFLLRMESMNTPMLGDKEPLTVLAAEFPIDSYIIQEKIKLLVEYYASFRRARRDGNCFYRSFFFSYLEQLYGTLDGCEVSRLIECLEQSKMDYVNLGYDEDEFTDNLIELYDAILQIPESKQEDPNEFCLERKAHFSLCSLAPEDHCKEILNESTSNRIMTGLKMVTTIEMCKREEFYKPFLGTTEYPTMLKYCWKEVIPLGVEADNLKIIALSNALGIPVRIVVIDSSSDSPAEVKLQHYDFIPGSESTAFTLSTPRTSVVEEKIDTESSSVLVSDSPVGTTEANVTDIGRTISDPSQPSLEEEKTNLEPNNQPQAAICAESSGTSTKNISADNIDVGSSSVSASDSPVPSEIVRTTPEPSQPSLEEKKTESSQPQAGNSAEIGGTSRTDPTTYRGTPFVTLLYRPGHYDILYRK